MWGWGWAVFLSSQGKEGDGNKGGGVVLLVGGRQKNTELENVRVQRGEHSSCPAARKEEGGCEHTER